MRLKKKVIYVNLVDGKARLREFKKYGKKGRAMESKEKLVVGNIFYPVLA